MTARECATQWLRAKDRAEASGFFGSPRIECVCRAYLQIEEAALAWLESVEDLERPESGDYSLLCELRDLLATLSPGADPP
jgi:hypothetical protein